MSIKKQNLENSFNTAYKNLNAGQREAVDTIEGPVMVIAGPGTGKTQILTLRIANILRLSDTKPGNILALTFTDSGVRAMRNRLTSFIGTEAYQVPIHTFHSFAGELIRNYPDSYENIVGGKPASDLEKIKIIEDLLEEKSYKQLRPHGDHSYYVKPILNAIATLKKENVSPDKFANSIKKQAEQLETIEKNHTKGAHKGKVKGDYLKAEKFLERNQELLYIYRLYVADLKNLRLYDFEDMILDTIKALETNQEMLFDVQEQYQYILADEHQDVNQSQNRLIELISSYHEQPNIFVVGDEKQAIYRFQGASLQNFLFFEDVYPSAKTIALTNNYRSDQNILDLAHDSIKTDDEKLKNLRVPLVAMKQYEASITKQIFAHRAIEDAWIIDQLKKHHEVGTPWEEMAVIVRTNKEIEQLTSLMRKSSVPVNPSADSDILEHPIFLSLKNLLRAAVEINNEAILAEVLQAPYWNIVPEDLIAVLMARSFSSPLLKIISQTETLNELNLKNPAPFLLVKTVLEKARADGVTKSPAAVLENLLQASGFRDFVLEQNLHDSVRVVRRFYDEVEAMFNKKEATDLKSVLQRLDLMEKHTLSLTAPFIETSTQAVSLITAHKAKGLEFEVVFIPHLSDNVWGGSVRASLFELPIVKPVLDAAEAKDAAKAQAEDDERRLFYVALTRAKRVLECSYASTNTEGRDFSESRFLLALDAEKITQESTLEYENNFSVLTNLKPETAIAVNSDFLRTALNRNGWSATSFNNYHNSPWDYIYKNVLRIPTIKTPELQFGTAVHAVLEKVVAILNKGEEVTVTEVKKQFDQVLGKSPLSVTEFTRLHERGLEAVMTYLPTLTKNLTKTNKTEYSLQAILVTGIEDFPEVILKGNFDRLDFDEFGKVKLVIDYKTGKPKTRGVIEGMTKDSNGNYKRQLVFYALLLSLHPETEFHCQRGVLSFVEPDKKGVIHEEEFEITDEEITDLKQQIIEATKAVITGQCLTMTCDNTKSDYCHLVEFLNR